MTEKLRDEIVPFFWLELRSQEVKKFCEMNGLRDGETKRLREQEMSVAPFFRLERHIHQLADDILVC